MQYIDTYKYKEISLYYTGVKARLQNSKLEIKYQL